MQEEREDDLRTDAARKRRKDLDELLTSTFTTILRVEERALQNKLTRGLTISECTRLLPWGFTSPIR